MTNVGGWLADRMMAGGMSTSNVRKIMQIIGLLGGATFLLFLQDAQDSTEALLLMCAVLGIASFTVSGFGANPLDISPRHAAVLVGISNTVGTVPGIVGVALTGYLLDVTGTYDSVFMMVAAINVIGAVIWLVFSSGERLVE